MQPPPPPLRELLWVPVMLVAAFLTAGALFQDAPFAEVGRVVILGTATLASLVLLAATLAAGGQVEVRSHWGGLGGGLGGWRLSPAAVYLLLAVGFGVLTAASHQPAPPRVQPMAPAAP